MRHDHHYGRVGLDDFVEWSNDDFVAPVDSSPAARRRSARLMRGRIDDLAARVPPKVASPEGRSDLDRTFEAFHEANPQVYDRLVELAREWLAAGHERCSLTMLYEVLRYDQGLGTISPSGDGWRLNNSFRSRYARLITAQEPDLRGAFELRQLAT